MFNKYPHFKLRGAVALRQMLDWPDEVRKDPVDIRAAEDGSGVGAALIAALTLKRVQEGVTAGVRDPEAIMMGTKSQAEGGIPETKP